MEKTKILIVEDEAAIAQDLLDILEIEGYEVTGIAYTYDQALSNLASIRPDLVFLDIALRGRENGLQVADVINEKYKAPIIFLTSFSDSDTMKEVVKRNPSAYLVKPFKERDIVAAIALTLAKENTSSKEGKFPSLDIINKKLSTNISRQEYKVLELLCAGHKNQEIGDQLFVSLNTVKSHVKNIFVKLNVKSRMSVMNLLLNL